MKPRILIIDDNRKYTALLRNYLETAGGLVEHVLSSKSGMETIRQKPADYYDIIITDITMETQVSGIFLVRRIRKSGFRGCLTLYSTGFNLPWVLSLSRLFFRLMGADGLMPKDRLKRNEPTLARLSRRPELDWLQIAISDQG